MSLKSRTKVLLVDDHVDDISWLVDVLEWLGYAVDPVSNEEAARKRIESINESIAKDENEYALAIIDVMVSIKEIMDLGKVDSRFYGQSRDTGIRLCHFAREELGISPDDLPIVCISARGDVEVEEALRKLDIKLFDRTSDDSEGSIRSYLERTLGSSKLRGF